MTDEREFLSARKPCFVAIVGGSGAGKSWLAARLQEIGGKEAACVSLDDFYLDRSHLAPEVRCRINFDHPRAIDWQLLEQTLNKCAAGQTVVLPQYDFSTHSRRAEGRTLNPKRLIIVEGLWLLRPLSLRRIYDFSIYLDCPEGERLRRRVARDCCERGRDETSVKAQFAETVKPMHDRFVAPQRKWAQIVYSQPPSDADVHSLAEQIQNHQRNHP